LGALSCDKLNPTIPCFNSLLMQRDRPGTPTTRRFVRPCLHIWNESPTTPMRRSIAARRWLLALLGTALLALVAQPASAGALPRAAVVYVAPDGDDTRDCSSPATRCATLQRALEALADGGEARLATGVYTGTASIERSAVVRGGYRLPDYMEGVGASVLDGRRMGTTLRIAKPIMVRLARLTIVGGLADPRGESTGRGGGIFVRGANVLLDRVDISNNIADTGGSGRGGGIYIRDGSLTLTSSTVTSNTASLISATTPITGAIPLEPRVVDVTGSGGGIYAQDARITIRQSLFSENHASIGDAGLTVARSGGGGIYATGCTLEILETVFRDNDALGLAGGGGAIQLLSSQARLRGGEIGATQAPGSVPQAQSAATLDIFSGTTILDSLALRGGPTSSGGILVEPAAAVSPTTALTLTNVLLAEHSGPALQLLPNGVGRARAELRHTTVVSNGIGILAGAGQTAHIINSLIARNDLGTRAPSGAIMLEYTDRYDNRLDADGEVVLGPAGGLALPPRFVMGDRYYRLTPESPLLDQGTPLPGIATDFEGHARNADGDGDGQARPDLGWDELARSAAQFGVPPTLYGLPGQIITTTLELRNAGSAADSFHLSADAPGGWSVSIAPDVATLGPRTGTSLVVTIGIPARVALNSTAIVTIQATGRTSAAVAQIFVGVGEP
jgi:hypothetical protein